MPLITLILAFLLLISSSVYCADFAQIGTVGTSSPAVSPVRILEDKRHVLCDKCPPLSKFNPVLTVQSPSIAIKIGKPKEVKEPIIVEENKVIYFSLGKFNPKGGEDIKEVASYVSSIESVAVRGFTCDIGSKEFNDKLAFKRAEVVSEMLQKLGVPKEKISVEGLGKCCYKLSPAQSRRAEITLKIKKQ